MVTAKHAPCWARAGSGDPWGASPGESRGDPSNYTLGGLVVVSDQTGTKPCGLEEGVQQGHQDRRC